MPKAILALRNYPVALFAALLLFVLSFVIATSSLSTIRGGGGDDQGSGMGGTGKSGHFGDSGFGGTGAPLPYWGDSEQEHDESTDEWPAPWLPREQETAAVPEAIQPLIDLQQNPPVNPMLDEREVIAADSDTLHIFDPEQDPAAVRFNRMTELAERDEAANRALEINLQVPEMPSVDELPAVPDIPQLATKSSDHDAEADAAGDAAPASDNSSEILRQLVESIPEVLAEQPEAEQQLLRPDNLPDRIQRPELPQIQRMRPAVDRGSVSPAAIPKPMRI